MKKTLIALAAVAASSVAFAQSSVTLSGTLDMGLEDVGGPNSPLTLAHSRYGTSNWTLSGTEDLGGGLKAIFKMSTSFASDTGTTAPNVLGNNDLWVGLQGGFGSLKLGRSYDPVFWNALTANSTKGVTGYNTRNGTLDNNGVYVPNQILYTTPNLSGFVGHVSYAPSEAVGVKAHTGLGLAYNSGPLALSYAYSKTPVLGGFQANALNQFGAAWDFGVARVLFNYTDRSNTPSNLDNSWALGVTAPVGPGRLWASYDKAERNDTRVFHGGYQYFLSKRTTAYLNLGNKKVAGAKATTGWGLGLAHNF